MFPNSNSNLLGFNPPANNTNVGSNLPGWNPSTPQSAPTSQSYNQNATTTGGAILPNPMSPGSSPTPTPVVSSSAAANGPVATAQNAVNAYDQVTSSQSQNLYDTTNGWVTPYGLSQGAVAVQPTDPNFQQNNTNQPVPVNPVNPTLEDIQANEVLHPGQVQMYNIQTGAQEWVAPGTPGYSSQNPMTRTDFEKASGQAGIEVRKFSDGTYGRFNMADGSYVPTTESDYLDAKRIEGLNLDFDNARKGIYNANQQAQLDGLKQQFDQIIEEQRIANANLTGGTTIAMNRSGLGNQVIGQQQITKTVTDGLREIAKLTVQRDGAIAKMKSAFESDNMALLKDAYTMYKMSSDAIQKQIDGTQAKVADQQYKIELRNMDFATKMAAKYDTGDDPILGSDTPEEVMRKVKNSPAWQNEQTKKAGIVDEASVEGALKLVNAGGAMPSARDKDLYNAVLARLGGAAGDQIIGNNISNKVIINGLKQANSQIEKKRTATVQSRDNFLQSADRALNLIPANDGGYYGSGGSPLINQVKQIAQGKLGLASEVEKSKLSAFGLAIESTIEEYAKLSSGAQGSVAATTASARQRAAELLNKASTPAQLRSTIDLMKTEVNGIFSSMDVALNDNKGRLFELAKNPNGTTYIGGGQTSSTSSGSTTSGGQYDW